jgi:hypothetical protein
MYVFRVVILPLTLIGMRGGIFHSLAKLLTSNLLDFSREKLNIFPWLYSEFSQTTVHYKYIQ